MEGPLDMRMDASTGETAAQYLERVPQEELEARLREAGEERLEEGDALEKKGDAPAESAPPPSQPPK